jgi:hypothetical protein
MSGNIFLWLIAVVIVAACVVLALVAQVRDRPMFGLPALVPAAAGLLMHAGGLTVHPPTHGWVVVLSVVMAALAVVAGSPLTIWVLSQTQQSGTVAGPTGGLVVHDGSGGDEEILRGGTTIGYLERLAVVGAIAVGRLEIVAAVIAVKGLGRFTELSTSVTRERFIIGTLVSLLWAGLCAGLVWPF